MNAKNNTIPNTFREYILFIVFGCFTFTIFAPLEIFLVNMSDFDFGLYHLLPMCLLCFILLFLSLSIIALTGSSFFPVLCKSFFLACCVIAFAAYIQGNYLGNHNGVMDGRDIDWHAVNKDMILSIALWIIAFCLCIVVILYKNNSTLVKTIRGISVFLIILEIFTISVLLISSTNYKGKYEEVVTKKDEFLLSKDTNLIVIIIDTFDGDEFESGFDEYTESVFEDFTFFPDTLSVFGHTDPSVPQMITGIPYKNNITYGEYLNEAFHSSDFIQQLTRDNWDIGLYVNCQLSHKDLSDTVTNIEQCRLYITKKEQFIKDFCRLVAYKYAPYPIKRLFWFYPEEINDLVESDDPNTRLYSWGNDIFWWDANSSEPLNPQKAFRVYHLYGMHQPYIYNSECVFTGDTTSFEENYMSNIVAVDKFLKDIKEKDLYDNSAIIVCADHGYEYKDDKPYNQNPLLLIKGINEKHAFRISETKATYEYLTDIYNNLINGKNAENSVNGYEERYYYWFDFDHELGQDDFLPPLYEYKLNGLDAGDTNNLESSGVVFKK